MNIRDHINEATKKKEYSGYRFMFWFLLIVVAALCTVLKKMPILIGGIGIALLLLAWGARIHLQLLRQFDKIAAVLEEHPSYSLREIAIATALLPANAASALSNAVSQKILCDFDPSTIPAEPKTEDKNFALRVKFENLTTWRNIHIAFFVVSLFMAAALWLFVPHDNIAIFIVAALIWGVFALSSRLSLKTCKAFKKSLAVLLTHPNDTFTELAPHVGHTPGVVRLAFENAVKKGVLPGLAVDVAADRLVEAPIQPEPDTAQEEVVSVSCPNCGANVTVSSSRGGKCEYCNTRLPRIK